MLKESNEKKKLDETKAKGSDHSKPDCPRVKAIFDSTKERVQGAHGIGCKN